MIRINLLRSTGLTASPVMGGLSDGDAMSADQGKVVGTKIVAMLFLPLLVYGYEYTHLAGLNSQLDAAVAQAAAVEKKKAVYGDAGPKVERFTKQKEKIDAQIAVIRSLTKNRLREVKALDSLQEITPPPVWFDDITMENGLVRAKGYSLTDEGLNELFAKLTNSAIFSRFEPKSQTYKTAPDGTRTLAFEIEFRVGKQDLL